MNIINKDTIKISDFGFAKMIIDQEMKNNPTDGTSVGKFMFIQAKPKVIKSLWSFRIWESSIWTTRSGEKSRTKSKLPKNYPSKKYTNSVPTLPVPINIRESDPNVTSPMSSILTTKS